MAEKKYETISSDALASRIQRTSPDNEDPNAGYALVNVLGREQFDRERIPGSANIPQGQEDDFEKRFAKDKEIIVYCGSPECDASEKAAEELARRGFQRVLDFEGGVSEWRDAGHPLTGASAS